MNTIKEIALRFIQSIIASLLILWWFQPTIFKAGMNRMDFIIVLKALCSIGVLWWFIYSIIHIIKNQNQKDLENKENNNYYNKAATKYLEEMQQNERIIIKSILESETKSILLDADTPGYLSLSTNDIIKGNYDNPHSVESNDSMYRHGGKTIYPTSLTMLAAKILKTNLELKTKILEQ